MHRHWFESIVPHSAWHTLLVAAVIWLVIAVGFAYMLGAFDEIQTPDTAGATGTGLFFASMVVYAVLAGTWVIRKSGQLVDLLELTCDVQMRKMFRQRLTHINWSNSLMVTLGGLIAGVCHTLYLQGTITGFLTAATGSRIALAGTLGTWAAWLIISHVVVAFISNARTFALIGQSHVKVDLLHADNHNLLGRAALMPTIGLIGTQALYPLLWWGGQVNLATVLPGFIVTLVALVYLFVRTSLPLHRRLTQEKTEQLEKLNVRIQALRGDLSIADLPSTELMELQALVEHRNYLQSCPEWPFRLTTIARWSLYLLIPPLTWVGAALIENVVDVFLA